MGAFFSQAANTIDNKVIKPASVTLQQAALDVKMGLNPHKNFSNNMANIEAKKKALNSPTQPPTQPPTQTQTQSPSTLEPKKNTTQIVFGDVNIELPNKVPEKFYNNVMQLANNIFSKNEIKEGLMLFLKRNMRKDDVLSQILYNKFKNELGLNLKNFDFNESEKNRIVEIINDFDFIGLISFLNELWDVKNKNDNRQRKNGAAAKYLLDKLFEAYKSFLIDSSMNQVGTNKRDRERLMDEIISKLPIYIPLITNTQSTSTPVPNPQPPASIPWNTKKNLTNTKNILTQMQSVEEVPEDFINGVYDFLDRIGVTQERNSKITLESFKKMYGDKFLRLYKDFLNIISQNIYILDNNQLKILKSVLKTNDLSTILYGCYDASKYKTSSGLKNIIVATKTLLMKFLNLYSGYSGLIDKQKAGKKIMPYNLQFVNFSNKVGELGLYVKLPQNAGSRKAKKTSKKSKAI